MEEKLNGWQKLMKIQTELDAPKGQWNSFSSYHYRSCEDILQGIKPLLKKYNCILPISDKVVLIGDRYYIEATVKIINCDDGAVIQEATSFAREIKEKKGMDMAQITGSVSSYARKYALNGLLAIDDNKDPDSKDNNNSPSSSKIKKEGNHNNQVPPELLTAPQLKKIDTLITSLGIDRDKVKQSRGVISMKELWKSTATTLITELENYPSKG
jgi:hypothetical protein